MELNTYTVGIWDDAGEMQEYFGEVVASSKEEAIAKQLSGRGFVQGIDAMQITGQFDDGTMYDFR